MNIKSKISSGLDEKSSSVIKLFDENVLWGLSRIFNLSLSQGKFIEFFKVAKIVAVYKKGKKLMSIITGRSVYNLFFVKH